MGESTKNLKAWSGASPVNVVSNKAAAASGTYQAAAGDLGRLHVVTFDKNVRILSGTGASVTATAGMLWAAFAPHYWRPSAEKPSLGYFSLDGDVQATIGTME